VFSIRKKDGLARIGTLNTPHGKIITPSLLPVLNPNRQLIPPSELLKSGAEAFITNAYLLYRDFENRQKALKQGLHKYLGYSGPLMTDSGAFQLMEYGEVDITNIEVTKFQEQIGSDLGVFLDSPTKGGTHDEYLEALNITLNRAEEHIQHRDPRGSTIWAGPIQGGLYLDLVKKSCLKMREMNFSIHPIGSVVPLMERYDYESVFKMVLTAKQNLPFNRPIHLFGAGHPMIFAVATFLGVDMFDSAAYILYAQKNRYITVFGTSYLENLQYFPCSCEICQSYTVKELKDMNQEERTIHLAKHNLNVSFEEIRRIKQAILEGRLYELVVSRVMNHPSLARLIDFLFSLETSRFIEPYDPISKSRALLITHPSLVNQPLLLRYQDRIMERFYIWSSTLLIGQDFQNLPSSDSYQVIRISPIFGIVPDELKGVYPLVQHERIPLPFSHEIIQFIKNFLKEYTNRFQEILIHPSVNLKLEEFASFQSFDGKKQKKAYDLNNLCAILDYHFGVGTHKLIDKQTLKIERSRKTGILRRFFDKEGLLGTFRAQDFSIIPSSSFAKRLHNNIKYPNRRVIAAEESIPFILNNKDMLAKFVTDADPTIRPGEEVLIVDKNDVFLNFGTSALSAQEMLDFKRGIAVQVRR